MSLPKRILSNIIKMKFNKHKDILE